MITKERLVELIYSCRNATVSVSQVVDTILKESNAACNGIQDNIRRYKEKGSGLEKCVDEVYDILHANSPCSNNCDSCSCSGLDPYGQSRFSDPEEAKILIKFLQNKLGNFFDINLLDEVGVSVYMYVNDTYELSSMSCIKEEAISVRTEQIRDTAFDMAEEEVRGIMKECVDPFFELGLILGYKDIEVDLDRDDVVIISR